MTVSLPCMALRQQPSTALKYMSALRPFVENSFLVLTPAGQEIAETIYERHKLLSQWLTWLGVPPDIAAEDACKIEHDLSPESFQALKDHIAQHQDKMQ